MSGHVATAECEIDVEPEDVWEALTDPAKIREYMFGSDVSTDWTPGQPDPHLEGRVRSGQAVRGQGRDHLLRAGSTTGSD